MTQIIYGIHPVREALRSAHPQLEKILVGTDRPQPPLQAIIAQAEARRIPVRRVPAEALTRMTHGGVHQNVAAIPGGWAYAELEDLLCPSNKRGAKALFLVLDGIQDPQNLGSLIRTGLGCGAQGIIIPKDRAVGITPIVIKASAGATAYLPVARVVNLATTLERMKKEGLWVYGASAEAKDRLGDLDLTVDLALVIGAEGKGIRPLVKKKCDRLFSIPVMGPIPSFNAGVSGGMVLYEAMRQRNLKGENHDSH